MAGYWRGNTIASGSEVTGNNAVLVLVAGHEHLSIGLKSVGFARSMIFTILCNRT